MNIKHQSMKKIKKKKFLLQQFKHKPIKSLDISEILLSEDDVNPRYNLVILYQRQFPLSHN